MSISDEIKKAYEILNEEESILPFQKSDIIRYITRHFFKKEYIKQNISSDNDTQILTPGASHFIFMQYFFNVLRSGNTILEMRSTFAAENFYTRGKVIKTRDVVELFPFGGSSALKDILCYNQNFSLSIIDLDTQTYKFNLKEIIKDLKFDITNNITKFLKIFNVVQDHLNFEKIFLIQWESVSFNLKETLRDGIPMNVRHVFFMIPHENGIILFTLFEDMIEKITASFFVSCLTDPNNKAHFEKIDRIPVYSSRFGLTRDKKIKNYQAYDEFFRILSGHTAEQNMLNNILQSSHKASSYLMGKNNEYAIL